MKLHQILFQETLSALHSIREEGYYTDKTLERIFKRNPKWGSRDRKFVAQTVYEIVRSQRWLEALCEIALGEKKASVEQLFWCQWLKDHSEVPDWCPLSRGQVLSLQKVSSRESERRQTNSSDLPLAVQESYPDWLFDLAGAQLGPEWLKWVRYLNRSAPVFLRANTLKIQPENLEKLLREGGIRCRLFEPRVPQALRLEERQNVFTSQAFHKGLFEVQDASSQLVAPLLEVTPGLRIVDACAGAGGKSLHLAALAQNKGKIIAMDVSARKLEELRVRARRGGVDIVETRLIESTKTLKRMEESADRLLLDVPCSGLGVIRRNPDTKWKLSKEELSRLVSLQRQILQEYPKMLKVGGLLVYATCSLLPSENEKQIEVFLAENQNKWAVLKEIRIHPPEQPGGDAFFKEKGVKHLASDGFYAISLKKLAH